MADSMMQNTSAVFDLKISNWCIENIETLAPAVVTDVKKYKKSRVVNVLPLIMEKQADFDVLVPTTLYDCPVIMQGNGDGSISYPLKVGDTVMIGYAKRSIEEFIYGSNASQYLPVDTRLFGSSDAVVLGYIGQSGTDKEVDPDNLAITFKDSHIKIKSDDSIELLNPKVTVNLTSEGNATVVNAGVSAAINSDGTVDITSTGDVTVNGAVIGADGNVTTASGTDLDAFKALYDAHGHASVPSLGVKAPPTPI